jgi:hypothetical protein
MSNGRKPIQRNGCALHSNCFTCPFPDCVAGNKISRGPGAAERLSAQYKAKRDRLEQAGICKRCGKHPAAEGRLYCEECLAYMRNQRRTMQDKERHATRQKELALIRERAGVCKKCGRAKPEEGKLYCEGCLAKMAASKRKRTKAATA